MQRAVSTYLLVKERLHPGILDGLVRSGVQAIEIFAARQHIDYANRKSHVKEIADWFRGNTVPLNSVHSPLYADYEWGRAGAPPVNIASTDRATAQGVKRDLRTRPLSAQRVGKIASAPLPTRKHLGTRFCPPYGCWAAQLDARRRCSSVLRQ